MHRYVGENDGSNKVSVLKTLMDCIVRISHKQSTFTFHYS